MWSYLTIPVVRFDSDQMITQQYHPQATLQQEEDLLKIASAKI
jgi:hypothetical protein